MREDSIKEQIQEAKKGRPKTVNYVIVLAAFIVLLAIAILFMNSGGQELSFLGGESPPPLPDAGKNLVSEGTTPDQSPPADIPQLPGF